MPYLRHALTIVMLLLVVTLAVPLPTSQDDNKADDASSQSDNSNDQQSDQIVLSDFIFENLSIFQSEFPDETPREAFCEAPDKHLPIQISSATLILPPFFISQCGLMPRAPTRT